MDASFEQELSATAKTLPDCTSAHNPALRRQLQLIAGWLRELPPPTEPGAWLQVRAPQLSPVWQAADSELLIGRGADCQIQPRLGWVSTRHCRIIRVDQDWLLEDLASTNGTWVNGRRIDRCPLRSGDVIQLSEFRILFLRTDIDPRI